MNGCRQNKSPNLSLKHFSFKPLLPAKTYNNVSSGFCLLQMLTDELEWSGLLVDYYDVFISCLYSHSDGTHSL